MIPSIAHFIWFGTEFPWMYVLALRSAAARGGFEQVILHHADDLSGSRWWDSLQADPRITTRRLDPEAVLGAVPERGDRLVDLFRLLEKPAARANMVRAALLWHEGGVYLDTDTVTVADLTPLRERATAFCGEETVVFPGWVKRSKDPLVHARAWIRLAVRDGFRRVPHGWRGFRRIEDAYPRAVNNAVLAAAPADPFIGHVLDMMLAVPAERRKVRFALGTHLLQDAVSRHTGLIEVHPAPVFYPLGPEISEHWFRSVRKPKLDAVLSPATRVVHWYASVRTRDLVPQVDPDWVRAHADRQLFSALALPFVDGEPHA